MYFRISVSDSFTRPRLLTTNAFQSSGGLPRFSISRENRICIAPSAARPQPLRIVHPNVDNDLGRGAVAEEQAKALPSELGSEPVAVLGAECVALAVFGARRISRYRLEHQAGKRRQELGISAARVRGGSLSSFLFDRSEEPGELVENERMG